MANIIRFTNQATDTIYVNAEWAAAENGDTVGDGYLYGYNAVSSFTDVADMINLDGSDTVIKIEGNFNVDKTMDFTYNTGNITFTADEAVTVSQTAELDFGFVLANDITVTVDENVTFNIYSNNSGWYMYYGPSLELYGTITGGGNWGCTYLFDGTHTVYESGEISTGRVHLGYTDITVKGTVDTNYLLAEASVFTAQGATITAGVIHDSNNGGMRWGAAEFNFTDASVVNAGNIYLKYADSVMNINNSTLNVSGAFENAGIVNITDTAFTDVITNKGTVELNGNVTLDADAISGTAAVDSDKDAVLSVTDFVYDAEGANLLINANVGIEQIVSVNGCEVNTVVGSYYYVENDTVYHLGVSGEQIIVAQIDGTITIETEAVQKDGEYSFVFTVASDGIGTDDEVVYTLTVNGKNYAVTDNTVTWTAADFAGSLPASFDYIITATDHFGRTGVYNGTFTDIKDYDNPYAENIKFADGKLSFAVADNSGLFSSVTVNGAEAEIVDGICSVDAVAGETYTIVVTDKAGLTAEYTYKVAEPVKPADNGSSVIASGTDIVTESITSEGNVNIGSNSNVVTEEITVAPGENNNVVLNNNVELTVTGSVDVSANLFVSSASKVNINNFNGTDEGDDIYIGKDSVANFAAVDMKDGYDTAYIAGGVEFTADSVSNLDSLNIAAEGKVVVKNAWDVAGTDDAVIKVGSYASFEAGSITGDSVNLTLNRNANAVIGDANINKLTVQAGAMLKVGKVTATAEDNVFSMAGSTAVINGIDFGDGNDTLTLSSGANLILTGAIDGLERISANRSATIFVADTAAKDALAQISGYKESIVDIVDYQSGIVADGSIYDVIGGGNADLFVLSGDDTLTIDGVASENISYFSIADKTWLTATDNFSFNAADVSLVKVESALDYKATLA